MVEKGWREEEKEREELEEGKKERGRREWKD